MPDVCVIDWHVHLLRVDRWLEAWTPAAERSLAFGASDYKLVRSEEDPYHFLQISTWEDRADFDRYWQSEELAGFRQQVMGLHNQPLRYHWHSQVLGGGSDNGAEAS